MTYIKKKIFGICRLHRDFLFWALLAILIRFLVMPFFAHPDFLSMYRRVYKLMELGGGYPQADQYGLYIIHYVWLFIVKPLLPDLDSMFYFLDFSKSTSSVTEYMNFVNNPTINRTLFVLKLLFLIFDILTAWIIKKITEDQKYSKIGYKVWLFNPITIYAFYIFGRHESITIFFLALTILFIKRKKIIQAAIMLGIVIMCREIMILFVPLFIFTFLSKKNLVKLTVSVFILAFFKFSPYIFYEKILNMEPLFAQSNAFESSNFNAIFQLSLSWLAPFLIIYCLLCIWLIQNLQSDYYKFIISSSISIIAFFAISGHSAHYVSWMVIFPIILMGEYLQFIKSFWILTTGWFVFWLFATDAGVFTWFLASPIDLHFTLIPTVPQIYAGRMDHTNFTLDTLLIILKNGYIACYFYMLLQFVGILIERNKKHEN